jgi:ABC-2 type transport system ATP-binding protein
MVAVRRLHRVVAALALVVAAGPVAGVVAAPVQAATAPAVRTAQVNSFDGTAIVTHFFPADGLAAGKRAPSVLLGPGWGSPGATNPADPTVAGLRQAGYNVVTWDPRGFGTSGGVASVDWYRYEGRDMQALLTWLAAQPEAQLDRPGDPRVGMAGGSYGGGIQFVTAAIDRRVDAIVPTIAWNSLVNSLYPNQTAKTGWGNLLCAYGGAGTNRVASEVEQTCVLGASGALPDSGLTSWWANHGPAGSLINRVHVPTMIVQGTADTLFPLREGIANYQALRSNGTPVKMVWFCGGHGVCLTPAGAAGHVDALTVAWFDRWLKRQRTTSTGPGFEYVDESGVWRGASAYPLPGTRDLATTGDGTLTFSPADKSGTVIAAQPAANAASVAVPAPKSTRQIVGSPRLTLRYQGTSTKAKTSLYAQLVDQTRGLVAGNFATALPLTLDGKPHTLSVPLGAVAWTLGPASKLTLQITGGSALYFPQQASGRVKLSASIRYPVAAPARAVSFGVS